MSSGPAAEIALLLEIAFAAAMLGSAAADLAWRRLPNWLNAAIAIAYFPWAWAVGEGWPFIAVAVVVGAVVLAIGFGLFAINVIGGGDAKFAAAVTIWIGFSYDLLRFFLIMSLAGGVLAILALTWQAVSRRPLRRPLPYGVAIAVAGLDHWLRQTQTGCTLMGC
jgi:prepilin peptidase CpaA